MNGIASTALPFGSFASGFSTSGASQPVMVFGGGLPLPSGLALSAAKLANAQIQLSKHCSIQQASCICRHLPASQPLYLFVRPSLPAGLNNIVVKAFWCAFSLPPLVVPLRCTFLSGRLRLPAHPVWLAWRTWWRYGRPCFCQSFLLSSSRPPCQFECISSVKKSMIVQKLYHHNTGIV